MSIHCFRSTSYRVFIASKSCCHNTKPVFHHSTRSYSHHNSNHTKILSNSHHTTFTRTRTQIHRYTHSQSNNRIHKQTFQIFASTLPGFESILSHELETKINISKDNQSITNGGISFDISSIQELYQCHLYLGTASHLLLRAPINNGDDGNVISYHKDKGKQTSSPTTFYAVHAKQLIQKVRNMKIWKELIPMPIKSPSSPKHYVQMKLPKLDIRVTCNKSKLYHTKLIAECVQKGIYKALDLNYNDFNTATHDIEEIKSSSSKITSYDPKICILVRIDHDEVQISIDTSLSPLHRRGYKLDVGKAPLREDLAYGFLYSLGWSNYSYNNTNSSSKAQCLIDPFCGSGTIIIEGASMALGLPPGRLRSAPCQFTNLHDKELWEEMVKSSMNVFQKHISEQDNTPKDLPLIIGSDRDEGAIQATLANAKRAGVENFIQVQTCSITANPWLKCNLSSSLCISLQNYNQILVATNPPYGLRISPSSSKQKLKTTGDRRHNTIHSLLALYQTLGNIVQRLKSYEQSNSTSDLKTKVENVHLGIMSHDMNLARKTGVRDLKKKFTTRLGGICVTSLGSC